MENQTLQRTGSYELRKAGIAAPLLLIECDNGTVTIRKEGNDSFFIEVVDGNTIIRGLETESVTVNKISDMPNRKAGAAVGAGRHI